MSEPKNQNFVQLYREHIDDLPKMAKENNIAFQIFMFVTKNMDENNCLSISIKTLTELFNVSRQTIWKANKYLTDHNFISIIRASGSNIYTANPEIVWTTYNNKKRYCKFNGSVLIAESEVDKEDIKNMHQKFLQESILDIVECPEPETSLNSMLENFIDDEV